MACGVAGAVVLGCCLVSTCLALLPIYFRNNLQRRYHYELQLLADESPAVLNCHNDSMIIESWFTQKYDQFDPSDTRTYGQRYFVNWKFHENSTNAKQPVVFLMIGGESEMAKRWVCWENYTYMVLAKQNRAIVIQLEHRFFGRNKDMPDLSTSNLKFLTTEQALADIASFIPAFSKANGLVNPRWVAFGGSYPGSMAAWLRVKYPELTVGNVASSAPIWPKVNFWEYSEVMEKTIRDTSEECYSHVGQAFKQLKTRTYSVEGRNNLTLLFNLEPKLEDNAADITNFFGYVFETLQDIIQYTYDARTNATLVSLNIREACNIITDTQNGLAADPVQRLANVYFWRRQLEFGKNKEEKSDIRYEEDLKQLKNVSLSAPMASLRGWMWLSCSEFGWLQTTDKGNSLFGDIISMGFYNKMCIDMFGEPMNTFYIEQQVAKAQKTFGFPWDYKVTNVILPNGAYDPWSALGTNVSYPDNHQISVLTPGAAHCSDMYPPYDKEPSKLAETRKRVMEEVNYYLKNALLDQPSDNSEANELMPNFISILLFLLTTLCY